MIPRSRGGSSTWENLVACCHGCNRRKGNRMLCEIDDMLLLREPRPFSLHTSRQIMRMLVEMSINTPHRVSSIRFAMLPKPAETKKIPKSPAIATGKSDRIKSESGPVLVPTQSYEWTLLYDPAANGGNGSVELSLGAEKVRLDLKPGLKKQGATFDRFGLLSVPPGGNLVQLYVDDLKYTAARAGSQGR